LPVIPTFEGGSGNDALNVLGGTCTLASDAQLTTANLVCCPKNNFTILG
jgi:hypothetical protein